MLGRPRRRAARRGTPREPWWTVRVPERPDPAYDRQDKGRPRRLPDDPYARAALTEWFDAPNDASLYVMRLDFRGADLTDVAFHYLWADTCDFSGTTLRRTDLAGSELLGTRFVSADLREAHFAKARLSRCRFDGADLRSAELRRIDASDCSFAGADLAGADLYGLLHRCDLSGVDLDRVATLDI